MTKKEKLALSNAKINSMFKVAGTDYDRRRKLTNKEIYNIRKSYASGKDENYLADKYGVTASTIKYHVVPGYKEQANKKRVERGFNTSVSPNYRSFLAEYKRYLIEGNRKLLTNF